MSSSLYANTIPRATLEQTSVVVLGSESVGKTTLLSAISRRMGYSVGMAGSTLRCERYDDGNLAWIDTPGLLRENDSESAREALEAVENSDRVMLVLRADNAVDELKRLAPLVGARRVLVVLTFSDKLDVSAGDRLRKVSEWESQLGVPVRLVDARRLSGAEREALRAASERATSLAGGRSYEGLPAFSEASQETVSPLLKVLSFPLVSIAALFGPAWISVVQANALADRLYEPLTEWVGPLLSEVAGWPAPLAQVLGGDYGILAMLPFLFLYALPTILAFSGILAFYKSTGLIDVFSVGAERWLRPFGLGGRELVRVVMGFGCNVPAVVATRSCHTCSRQACVSAISFGSACSYQLPATLAVFAAAGMAWLGPVYLAVLGATTLIYLRCVTPRSLRLARNRLLLPKSVAVYAPNWKGIRSEILITLRSFFGLAIPVFLGVCVVASLLNWLGLLSRFSEWLSPLMRAFNLPPEASVAVVLGSVRKDGLAIGLLDGEWNGLRIAFDTPAQVLTAVYLAGVLLPCLVTLLTIGREMRWRFAAKLLARQALFAALFSLIIAWVGAAVC